MPARPVLVALSAVPRLFAAVVVALAVSCSTDDAPKTWRSVSTGTRVGSGVTSLALDAQDHFIGIEETLGPVQSGPDPTVPWSAITGFGPGAPNFLGVSTRQPALRTMSSISQSTTTGWMDRGPPLLAGSYDGVIAVDRTGRLIVTLSGGAVGRYESGRVETLYVPPPGTILANLSVSPSGEVFNGDPSKPLEEIYHLANGTRTAMLDARGCPGAAASCVRSATVIGFDASDAMYVAIAAKNTGEDFPPYHHFHRYAGGAWTELPTPSPTDVRRGASCSVTAAGTIYCAHVSVAIADTDPDSTINLFRLGVGASSWSDLGPLPERELCHVVARDDGRVALTCSSLGGPGIANNDSLWVSTD